MGHIRERRQHSNLAGAATDLPHAGKSHKSFMISPSLNRKVGVMNRIKIPFVAL